MELLKELHILTREGRLNQDTRRKLKQVYHLYQFIAPLLEEVSANDRDFTLADHGAGKSYLGFILYDLFFNVAHRGQKTAGHIYGIETPRRAGGKIARAGCAPGLCAHVVPESVGAEGHYLGRSAIDRGHRDGPACMRHRHR